MTLRVAWVEWVHDVEFENGNSANTSTGGMPGMGDMSSMMGGGGVSLDLSMPFRSSIIQPLPEFSHINMRTTR